MYQGNFHLFLVDQNQKRRATVSYEMSKRGIYIVPFEAVEELASRWPDAGMILIADDNNNIAMLTELMLQMEKWLPFVAFAENPTTSQIVRAVNEGAVGYSDTPTDVDEFCRTVEEARVAIDRIGHIRSRAIKAKKSIESLTRREMEVLEGLAQGLTNRAVAEQLEISHRTVEIHRANLLTKLGDVGINAAIRLLIEARII
ncbi:LuxR family transcriptional regulator [Novosphingobium pentaromativorans US6-1]|uniref:LuxR family transcriptional regulator protein n=1 Tax=Novosphingobium pentaromativorans US6-1 TaxID=1088721 RepID=G6ED31_9SPHN|nr:LuxR family transcriptional regulator [Novosphingobium pentaromativorans US6-1]EHJ60870.1 LuxR family transcriptional regulator protein [Novosphingobium pentaromativorans US6-1]